MHRSVLGSVAIALSMVVLSAAIALGHGGEEGAAALVVEPASLAPGGTVLVVGTELEPGTERILQLKGENLVLGLGTATTSEAGRFAEEVEIPAFLPAGVYQLEAIGDETLTIELQVVGSAAEGASAVVGPELADEVPRDRGILEFGFILLLAAVSAVIGLFLVVRERPEKETTPDRS